MTDLFSMQGRRVLVTGGTRGLGRAVSLELAGAGALVLASFVRDLKSAESLVAEAAGRGLSIQTVRGDLSTEKGLEQVVAAVDAAGPLSSLVHCAATGVHRPFEQLTLRHFDFTFGLNLRAFFALVQQLLPRFTPSATVVGVSSEGAVRAVPQYTLVGSSKGALEAMLRHMAVELAPRGIRVNILAPGTLATDVWKVLPDSEARLKEAAAKSALGRLTTLEEAARVARFLCSDASSGMVGQTVVVDGGAGLRA